LKESNNFFILSQTKIDFSIIHLSTFSKFDLSKFSLGLKSHKFKIAYLEAFHNLVTNFLHLSISFSSNTISFHKFHPHAQYLIGSAQYFLIKSSGDNHALFFDLLIFSHFGAST